MNTGRANDLLKLMVEAVEKYLKRRLANTVQCEPAQVVAARDQRATVRLPGSPADGSQDFVVPNRSMQTLRPGDSVWLNHWGDYTNAFAAMRDDGRMEFPSGKNLLHNWDFRKPVNQRGQTSYSGAGYAIDRWLLSNGNGTLAITTGGVTLSASGGESYLVQRIEQDLTGLTVTASCNVGGTIYSTTATMSKTMGTSAVAIASVAKLAVEYQASTGLYQVVFKINSGASVTVAAAKLELGSVSTLANDPPADYGEQLALCQRYFVKFSSLLVLASYANSAKTDFYITVPVPVTLRVAPTVIWSGCSFEVYSGDTAVDPLTVSSVRAYGAPAGGCLTLIFKTSSAVASITPWRTLVFRINGSLQLSADL